MTPPSRATPIMGGLVSLALIAGVTLLLALGRSTGDLLSLIGVGIVPILTLMLNGKLTGIQAGTDAVRAQTNGHQGELVRLIGELQRELARRSTGPVPADDAEGKAE